MPTHDVIFNEGYKHATGSIITCYKKILLRHPAGIAFTSDWSANSFIMVVFEKFLSSVKSFCPIYD